MSGNMGSFTNDAMPVNVLNLLGFGELRKTLHFLS